MSSHLLEGWLARGSWCVQFASVCGWDRNVCVCVCVRVHTCVAAGGGNNHCSRAKQQWDTKSSCPSHHLNEPHRASEGSCTGDTFKYGIMYHTVCILQDYHSFLLMFRELAHLHDSHLLVILK